MDIIDEGTDIAKSIPTLEIRPEFVGLVREREALVRSLGKGVIDAAHAAIDKQNALREIAKRDVRNSPLRRRKNIGREALLR